MLEQMSQNFCGEAQDSVLQKAANSLASLSVTPPAVPVRLLPAGLPEMQSEVAATAAHPLHILFPGLPGLTSLEF